MTQPRRKPRRPAAPAEKLTAHPAVLVVRIPLENGNETISVVELNGFDPLAVPLFLHMAADGKEKTFRGDSSE